MRRADSAFVFELVGLAKRASVLIMVKCERLAKRLVKNQVGGEIEPLVASMIGVDMSALLRWNRAECFVVFPMRSVAQGCQSYLAPQAFEKRKAS